MSLHHHWQDFRMAICQAGEDLLRFGELVEVPTWQALDVKGKPQEHTFEVCDYSFSFGIRPTQGELAVAIEPNLPWAENHFQERVSGEPLNPPPSHEEWPWAPHNKQHQQEEKFSHTYPERYWPRSVLHLGRSGQRFYGGSSDWGDLNDVVNLLAKQPTTRQAYLPVFFPHDTGAVHGERIPCSLGYLFLMRERKLNIIYYIRSCDFYRHLRDDVYLTARLCQWVLEQLKKTRLTIPEEELAEKDLWKDVTPGRLTMHIGSLHVFEGDLPRLRREYATN